MTPRPAHRRPTRIGALLAGPMLVALSLTAAAPTGPALAAAPLNLTQYVNPYIGTDDSNSPNPVPGGAGGSTVPGPVAPFGMVQFSPDTPTASPSGYRYSDTQIQEFSLTHFNGAGCANNEDIGILPITGAMAASPGTSWTGYQATHVKASEVAQAGYYKSVLSTYGNTAVELTTTPRTGAMRLTYPATTSARVLVNTSRSATGNRAGSIAISGSTMTGQMQTGAFCGQSTHLYQIYFALQFDRAPSGVGTWSGGTISNGSTTASGVNTGGFATFDTSTNNTVNVKVAISFVSVANAQANLAAESPGFNFDGLRGAADTSWNDILNRVQATGGAAADLQKFYTAMYHVLQNPNIASDANGQYRGFDNVVHTATHPVYQNYSGWDVYRSWAALVALIAPTEASDIAKSMVLDGQQGGLLPKWSQQNQEDFIMTGDPGPIIVASMYAFGARNFDTAAALALMDKSSNGGTTQGSSIRGRQSGYVSRGYVIEDPSDSLEYSGSDFAVAQFARALGDTTKYNTYMQRAQWWRNVFNTQSGYSHRHNSDGTYLWPLSPADPAGYTEGNASQYTWMQSYNLAAQIALMGGPQTVAQRLDHHFTQLNGGLSLPYFYIGNEPEHGVPWTYNFAQKPAGASAAVRRVMNESFTTGAGGLPGNEDLGATSAWYVWAALGMYPATPAADTLALHGPLFQNILITRPTGNLQITGSGAGPTAQYVQSVSVNGAASSRNFIRYPEIANGGTLAFTMGSSASTWGTGAGDVPPSFTDGGTQPPAAPNLGTNLALGKSVTGSAACATGEEAAKVVDGKLGQGNKWCSLAAGTKTVTVDLGSAQTVNAFVVKHAGLGGESVGLNTDSFTIDTSTDNATFSTAATVTGNRSSRTLHQVANRSARYVRLSITVPTNNGNTAARISEFEVYGGGGTPGPTNVALNKPATGSTSCNTNEGPAKAVNGSVSGGNTDKFCSSATGAWLQVDLGSAQALKSFTLRHASAGGESANWNTKDFDIQTSTDGVNFSTAVQVRGNTAAVSDHPVNVSARYVRVNVLVATQDTNLVTRIYELEAYA